MSQGALEILSGHPVKRRTVELAGRSFGLAGPANYESLIDDPAVVQRFAKDEYLPYWAEFWPACVRLAEEVARWAAPRPGHPRLTVLEMGCGLGLCSLVAAWRGHRVIASDYEPQALEFVRFSAELNALPCPELRVVDWRQSYADLRADRIIAAEVLYERRGLAPIARFIAAHLEPAGSALICDAHRQPADGFAEIARSAGLAAAVRTAETSAATAVRLFELQPAPP